MAAEWLGHLGYLFLDWSNRMVSLGETIEGVPIIGEYLYSIVIYLDGLLYDMAEAAFQASGGLGSIAVFLDALENADYVAELIRRIFGDWDFLTIQPSYWVREQLAELWTDIYWFLADPLGWLNASIIDLFPWLPMLEGDFSSWIVEQLELAWTGLGDLIIDPADAIARWLRARYPHLYEFWDDPTLWLMMRLEFLTGIPVDAWIDLRSWVHDEILSLRDIWIDNSRDWIYEQAEQILLWAWERGSSE